MNYTNNRKIRILSLTILLLSGNCARAMEQTLSSASKLSSEKEKSLFFNAVFNGNLEKITELLKDGIDPNIQDDNGFTALILAASQSNFSVVNSLLDNWHVNPNIQNSEGFTALIVALARDISEIKNEKIKDREEEKIQDVILKLLACGADPYIISNNGTTALNAAASKKHANLIPLLINEQRKKSIPEKSCFLTFTQNDSTGAVVKALLDALANQTVAITSPYILNELFKILEVNTLELYEWNVFLNQSHNLCIVIPGEKPDIEQLLYEKFGFINLNFIADEEVKSKIEHLPRVSDDDFNVLIQDFKNIIDVKSPKHPTRFYFIGHGSQDEIANIPMKYLESIMETFSAIDTQFVYINSCHAGGENLIKIQKSINNIFEKQLKKNLLKQMNYEKAHTKYPKSQVYSSESQRSPVKTSIKEDILPEKIKRIDYSIAVQATSDITTGGVGNINAFFNTLPNFLKSHQGKSSITNLFQSLGLKTPDALQSIRLPGITSLFRAAELNNMEIITYTKLQALRLEKLLKPNKDIQSQIQLISQLKDELSEVMQREPLLTLKEASTQEQSLSEKIREAQKKLNKIIQETQKNCAIPINRDIKYVQIFPCNLIDFSFVIQGKIVPKFISKIPGQAQHFIGKIIFESSRDNFKDALKEFITNGFIKIFGEERNLETKCWGIKTLELKVNGFVHNIENLIIYISRRNPACFYFYKNQCNYKEWLGDLEPANVGKNFFLSETSGWFKRSQISEAALYEATGGQESYEMIKDVYAKFKEIPKDPSCAVQ